MASTQPYTAQGELQALVIASGSGDHIHECRVRSTIYVVFKGTSGNIGKRLGRSGFLDEEARQTPAALRIMTHNIVHLLKGPEIRILLQFVMPEVCVCNLFI